VRGRLRHAAGAAVGKRRDNVVPEFVADLSEPNSVDVGPRIDVSLDLAERLPALIGYFEQIRIGCALEAAAEDMHDLVFDQTIGPSAR
jgi:hypothetical protein